MRNDALLFLGHYESLWVILVHYGSLWVIPCFSTTELFVTKKFAYIFNCEQTQLLWKVATFE